MIRSVLTYNNEAKKYGFDHASVHVPFNFVDAKNRRIGCVVSTWRDEYVEAPADAKSGHDIEPGTYYVAVVHASRDGKSYGAYPGGCRVKTLSERSAYIERRIADSRKRAAKIGEPG